ncbi:MAG TPA: FG-GAP-like repeat-containing protein [Gaiellaceae bacterium]|nr:FG-GAP-like repeat-containing protein [Gaiellaceae bacterium]
MSAVVIRGTPYPIVLPKLSDPRLHLAATIISLQVIGQIGFHFQLSIAQILIALATCAVLEVAITARQQHVLMWPASALLTGNGVAFILRVPGTQHGDWWSLNGWWIYAGTAAVALLSKYLIKWRGNHIFNPSNIGLVLCFLVLGRGRANPLDFWWGPMSAWLVAALAIILAGGFLILSRLKLLWIALVFWLTFAAGIGVLALSGHAMTARWHLGPITGFDFWWVLVTSPEVLVFLFFMITDPKTAPREPKARIAYAIALGLLGTLLIAGARTEYASKVGLLSALAIVCLAMPVLRLVPWRFAPRQFALAGVAGLAVYVGALVLITGTAPSSAAPPPAAGGLPQITILPSRGVQSQLNLPTAQQITHGLVKAVPAHQTDRVQVWLEPGEGQAPPVAVAQLAGVTYRLHQAGTRWVLGSAPAAVPARTSASGPQLPGYKLTNVASQVGLDFRQGSFRYGMANEPAAMMGAGVCWLDFNNDGWLDLFVVNSYADDNLPSWQDHGGLPTSALFENEHGHFVNVTKSSGAGLPLKGEGCVAADFNGDGYTDLYITTATNDALLWNNGNGTFTEGARKAGIVSFGWHSGAAVADVNGDGRPDLFVAGYADMQHPIVSSVKGFPSNYPGVRDELFLNEGHRHFREVGARVGLDPAPYDHSLGAVFIDVNGDGRPDLYVANDEDPNRLYLNEPGGPLGFHFVDTARASKVADAAAGMGVAATDVNGDGRPDLFVSNSRRQTEAAYQSSGSSYTSVGAAFTRALGATFAGWGDSWVDLRNNARLDLLVASGGIPVTNLAKNAGPIRVLAQQPSGKFVAADVLQKLRTNGRGVAAADYDNDGRVDFAVNSIGGPLILLHNESSAGNWLEVDVRPFSPGAVVTVTDSSGRRQVREVLAGSSYLSSEDPRVHFGLGNATVRTLVVRYPDGTVQRLTPATNAIVRVTR